MMTLTDTPADYIFDPFPRPTVSLFTDDEWEADSAPDALGDLWQPQPIQQAQAQALGAPSITPTLTYSLDIAQAIMEFIAPIREADDTDGFLPKPILHLLLNYVEKSCEQISRIVTDNSTLEFTHPFLKHEQEMETFLSDMQDYTDEWGESPIEANDIMAYFYGLEYPEGFPPKPIGGYLMEVYRERVYAFAELVEEYYSIDGFTEEIKS